MRPVSHPPQTKSLTTGDDHACRAANVLLEGMEKNTQALKLAHCAVAEADAAAKACQSLSARARTLAARIEGSAETAVDEADVTLSADGHWVLQATTGIAHVFELGSNGLRPAYALETSASWGFVENRLFGTRAHALQIVDLKSGQVHDLTDVEELDESHGSLVLVGKASVRLVDARSFAALDTIPLEEHVDFARPRFLSQARAVTSEETIASFDRHAVVLRKTHFVSASAGENRIAVCDIDDNGALHVVDAQSWANLATFDTKDTQICGASSPSLTPDGQFVVAAAWPSESSRRLVPIVVEVATGKTKRFPNLAIFLSTALDSSVSFAENEPRRVCLSYGNMHWRKNECPWVIDERGQLSAKAEPKPHAILGIGDVEIARATSDDGTRIVVASYDKRANVRRQPDDYATHGRDLRVSFVDASSLAIVDTVPIVVGDFDAAPPSVPTLVQDTLASVTSTRAFFDPQTIDAGRAPPIGPLLIDAKTHEARPISGAVYIGHGIAQRNGALQDFIADRTFTLQFRNASPAPRQLFEPCPSASMSFDQ